MGIFAAGGVNLSSGGNINVNRSFIGNKGTLSAGNQIIIDGVVVGQSTEVSFETIDGVLSFNGVPFEEFTSGRLGPITEAHPNGTPIANAPASTNSTDTIAEADTTISAPASPTGSESADTAPAGFDATFYLQANPDVAAAGVDALTHYLQHGIAEGRDPNANFDESFYLSHNQDVADAVNAGVFNSGYEHYIAFGQNEGRTAEPAGNSSSNNATPAATSNSATTGFDSSWYLAEYSDVAQAGVDALTHYLNHGISEGRDPNGSFDESFYLQTYADVDNAVDAGDFASGYEHYVHFGQEEGRLATIGDSVESAIDIA